MTEDDFDAAYDINVKVPYFLVAELDGHTLHVRGRGFGRFAAPAPAPTEEAS